MILFNRKVIFLCFVFILLPTLILSQSSEGIILSNNLFTSFEAANLSPQMQQVIVGGAGQFPYSILISVNSNSTSVSKEYTLTIAIPQEIALPIKETLISLIQELSETVLPVNVLFLFQAGEFSRLPEEYTNNIPYGTVAFLNKSTENMAAVLLMPPSKTTPEEVSVVFGSEGNITPQWLLKQTPINLSFSSLITYRLNLNPRDSRISYFFKQGIPSFGIQFDPANNQHIKTVCEGLKTLILNFSVEEKDLENNSNYIFFSFLNSKNIWISERTLLVIYLLIATIVLFVASGFSLFKKNALSKQQDFLRIWYLIPITILVSSFSLYIGQLIAMGINKHIPLSPFFILSIKTFFSFLVVSFSFSILVHFGIPMSQVVYGYLLSLISILNIFVFTMIDIILLIIFLIEYIIIYFSHISKRTIPLFISTLLMLLPFAHYILIIWQNGAPEKITPLLIGNFGYNILYACIILPFQIMWLRILIRLNVLGKSKNFSSFKIYGLATIFLLGIMLALILLLIFTSAFATPKKDSNTNFKNFINKTTLQVIEKEDLPVELYIKKNDYLDLRDIQVFIDSKIPVLKYQVEISSKDGLPIYSSTFPYEIITKEEVAKAVFSLPYDPENKTSFFYTTKSNKEQILIATIFVQLDETTAAKVTRTCTVSFQETRLTEE